VSPGTALRVFHVVAGFAGLAIGGVGMRVPKTRMLHTRLGDWYFVAISAACLSAACIAILEWQRLWYFLGAAVGTYAFALVGYLAAKRRRTGWLLTHVVGVTSSYCGLVMAFVVTNIKVVPGMSDVPFFARLLPLMFLSTCLVAWVGVQVYRGRLPRRAGGAA
jgi:hypothetical protein